MDMGVNELVPITIAIIRSTKNTKPNSLEMNDGNVHFSINHVPEHDMVRQFGLLPVINHHVQGTTSLRREWNSSTRQINNEQIENMPMCKGLIRGKAMKQCDQLLLLIRRQTIESRRENEYLNWAWQSENTSLHKV